MFLLGRLAGHLPLYPGITRLRAEKHPGDGLQLVTASRAAIGHRSVLIGRLAR